MIPTLFEIGPFRVHIYGVMLAISFLIGSMWATRAAARRGIPGERVLTLIFWILVSSIVGARLHFVLGHPDSYGHSLDLFRLWEGGLTLYGGLVAALLVSFLYLRIQHIAILPVTDAAAPALALGEAVTRIGCFLNGCCFGRACEGPLCVHYPPDSYAAAALPGAAVYPSQLFLSAAMLLLFVVLWRVDRRLPPAGIVLGLYLFGQGVARYAIDFSRYYEPVDSIGALGSWVEAKSQVVALALALAGLVLVVIRIVQSRRSPEGADR
jgi:phosphatidylglycerol:prolipoprotein diacylglycerol transferase